MAHQIEVIDVTDLRNKCETLAQNFDPGDGQKYVLAMEIVESLTDIANTVSEVVAKWDNDVEKAHLDYDGLPNSVLDYIDARITADELKSAKDIIDLFENGELKGIVNADDTINNAALAAFEQRLQHSNTTSVNDEDIF